MFQSALAREGLGVQAIRLEQLDLVAAGANQPFLAQLAQQAHHDLAHAADRIGERLLRQPRDHRRRAALIRRREIEQVADDRWRIEPKLMPATRSI